MQKFLNRLTSHLWLTTASRGCSNQYCVCSNGYSAPVHSTDEILPDGSWLHVATAKNIIDMISSTSCMCNIELCSHVYTCMTKEAAELVASGIRPYLEQNMERIRATDAPRP